MGNGGLGVVNKVIATAGVIRYRYSGVLVGSVMDQMVLKQWREKRRMASPSLSDMSLVVLADTFKSKTFGSFPSIMMRVECDNTHSHCSN